MIAVEYIKDAPEPNATNVSILGALWIRPLKPLMKNFLFIAMMMAAKHPAIDLLGITIVAGNQTLDKTLINGLNVCQKLEINVPVYAGMPQPIMRQQIVADNIHGETGLDGPVFEPLTRQAESTHAVKYIIDTLLLPPNNRKRNKKPLSP